ncbi:MAG TPA: anthrone oxygenase family protein, partial [Reyranella sp.]
AFLGTGALCVALAAASYVWWDGVGGKLILIAGVIYVAGCIGVTMLFNVPLNDALAAVQPGTPEATALWSRYVAEWTTWNTVRTVAPLASAILFTAALV